MANNEVIQHTYESIAQRLRTLELQLPDLRKRYAEMDDQCDAFAELAYQILRDAATAGKDTHAYASATLESIHYNEGWLQRQRSSSIKPKQLRGSALLNSASSLTGGIA